MNDELTIRRALPSEAATLTEIAHIAKRHWGYPDVWIDLWRESLTVTSDYLLGHEAFAAEIDNQIIGFYSVLKTELCWELDHFWIRPEFMGRGFGRALFDHVTDRLRIKSPGSVLEIESEPNAESFYVHLGAGRVGEITKD